MYNSRIPSPTRERLVILFLIGFISLVGLVTTVYAVRDASQISDLSPSMVQQSAYDKVAELLRPTTGVNGNIRAVAATGDYAYALTTNINGSLLIYDTGDVTHTTFSSLDTPVANLSQELKFGLVRDGETLYSYGLNGVQSIDISQPNQPIVGPESGGPTVYNAVLAGGYLVGAARDFMTVYQLDPQPTLVHSATIGAGNTAYSVAVLDDAVIAGYYQGFSTGFKIFEYLSLDDLGAPVTVSTPDLAYHLHAFGDRLVACTSNSLDLYDIADPTNPVYLSQQNLGGSSWGRACVLDGENLVTNGDILRIEGDAFVQVDAFVPDRTLSDGFPYAAAVVGDYVYIPQTGRVLMLTRAPGGPLPAFEMIPDWAGLDTDIGVRGLTADGANCGWQPNEEITIWWDIPEVPLATFNVDENGCFARLLNLTASEQLAGSPVGEHKVTIRGQTSPDAQFIFEQVARELHVEPETGPGGLPVDFDGCGWDGISSVNVFWSSTGDFVTKANVDPGSGCFTASGLIPAERTEDFYVLLATEATSILPGERPADSSASVFWLQNPTVSLTPPEGPPGAHVPVAGCHWFPEEMVDFSWLDSGEIIDSLPVGPNGCFASSFTSLDPRLQIPFTATLGQRTIRASGVASNIRINAPFTVTERSLDFAPESGKPGDTIAASGCGWVENDQVTMEWGYPDTNNQPILWTAGVDANSGCFGRDIDVPQNTITGPIHVTATGDYVGQATAIFTVTHGGTIAIANADVVAGGSVSVDVTDGIVGESISFYWDDGAFMDAAGVTTPDFTIDLNIPLSAAAGYQTITAQGSKGFDDSADVFVLDQSTIAVISAGPYYADSGIEVEGSGWAAGEAVSFGLRATDLSFFPFDPEETITVANDSMEFVGQLVFPANLPGGIYTLEASGDKGRQAEFQSLTIIEPPPPAFTLNATYADPAPVLDGQLRTGEWDTFNVVSMANGFFSARSDETRLYLLLDVLADESESPLGDDNFSVTVDIFGDRQIDDREDLNFTLDGNGELILQEYTGPGSLIERSVGFMRSAVAPGHGCFSGDNTLLFSFPTVRCDRHRVYEIAIDLSTIEAEPGDVVNLGIGLQSATPAIDERLPADFSTDFTSLGQITLASSRLDNNPPSGTLTGIGSDGFTLEITQATQDADNSLQLVANKDTVVRVYPKVQAEALIRVFLYGEKDGQALPGSPLVTLATVPADIDRASLDDTANFLLPSSWTAEGTTNFLAMAENPHLFNSQAAIESVYFRERRQPIIWTMNINEGTTASPILPDPAAVARQEDTLETLLPISGARWVRRSWTEIGAAGAITTGIAKKALKDYYRDLEAAWAMGDLPSETQPDIFYGHLPTCDPDNTIGTSDPIWSGGQGIVAIGCPINSKRANMAHEVNHNLDARPRASATWGRHIGGCDAEQGDSNWPWLTGTMTTTINEFGFDPRLPWSDGQAGPNVNVFTPDWPEFMSYCRTSINTQPTQWISAYRWQAMFPTFNASSAPDRPATRATAQDVFYVSGRLHQDGSGSFDSAKKQPGFPTSIINPGEYSLELRTAGGDLITDTVVSFFASFTSVELQPLTTVFFSYQIPAHPEARQIVLKKGDDVLDTIAASANPPTVTVTAPSGGENWSGSELITWQANDVDGDALTFDLYYSPDNGGRWLPIGSGLNGRSHTVDARSLPGGAGSGGTGGKIRVVASDGFHATAADSTGTFVVPPSPPLVSIDFPADGETFVSNTWINLRGSASDRLGTTFPEEEFIWWLDGEPFDIGSATTLLLKPGQHEIRLTVSDGQGNIGEATITLSVKLANGAPRQFLPLLNN